MTPALDPADAPLGAHVSIAGGTHLAPARARAIGATAMQIFTKQANRWAERTCEDAECILFRAELARTDVRVTVAHDSYMINLASPDPVLRQRSVESFAAELARCEALELDFLVSHPGNYMDERASGIERNAESIIACLERVPGRTRLCLETTAGAGTVLGATFEELAAIRDLIPHHLRDRVGVCADTCHLHSAGYDIVGAFDDVWTRFDDVIGLEHLWVMHLNDSKVPFGSRRDRHQLIGFGTIGEEPFRRIMNEERLAHAAKLIETPKLDSDFVTDSCMLLLLRGYLAAPVASG
ncbi:MAG TPA: deoxyribonuclease IV [Gemmatimonadaceae bacterium]|nr:deoxyribonuclease IV [Gemmatimonadaceae bacterium]